MPYFDCDGTDFFAVHEAAGQAIAHARAGHGPVMLHVHLARWYGHFEGDAMTYRANGEVARERAERDCLQKFRTHVTETSLLDLSALDDIDTSVKDEIEAAVKAAKNAPLPEPADLQADVYVSY